MRLFYRDFFLPTSSSWEIFLPGFFSPRFHLNIRFSRYSRISFISQTFRVPRHNWKWQIWVKKKKHCRLPSTRTHYPQKKKNIMNNNSPIIEHLFHVSLLVEIESRGRFREKIYLRNVGWLTVPMPCSHRILNVLYRN